MDYFVHRVRIGIVDLSSDSQTAVALPALI